MNQWNVQSTDGTTHLIQFNKRRNKLIVDQQEYKLKSSNAFIRLIDYSINLNGTDCKLVVIGNKVDLSVNGTFLGSQKPYEPLENIPAWIYTLMGISTLGGIILFGLLGACIGLLMSTLYIYAGLKKKKGLVIGLFALCTVLQAVLSISVGLLLR